MGNAILRCFKKDYDDTPPPAPPHRRGIAPRPQFVPPAEAGLSNLALHHLNFESTSQVSEGLSQHVTLSKKAQTKGLLGSFPTDENLWAFHSNRYVKILAASREAASLVACALQVQRDALVIQTRVSVSSSWPQGVRFELHTLSVDGKLVGDGDGMTVHVNTKDPRESAIERRQARAIRDYAQIDALYNSIINCGYRIVTANNEEILAREYRIRLRGIDAPEMNMEYGQQAKDALRKLIQGKPLTIHLYDKDPYDRLVGDVYCNGIFVQEKLLRKGCAWHYEVFDKRPSFAKKEARNAGRGLWANPNPVEPWEFKKKERNRKKCTETISEQKKCIKRSTSADQRL